MNGGMSAWTCSACGKQSTTETFCDSCGAARPGYNYDGPVTDEPASDPT